MATRSVDMFPDAFVERMLRDAPDASRNPFAGKCIHGVPGARFERGALTNDACGHCQATKAASERR